MGIRDLYLGILFDRILNNFCIYLYRRVWFEVFLFCSEHTNIQLGLC